MDENVWAAHLGLIQLGHFDHFHIRLFQPHPLDERFGEHEEVAAAVIDRKWGEAVVEPSLERVVEGAFAICEAAFAAPPGTSQRKLRQATVRLVAM